MVERQDLAAATRLFLTKSIVRLGSGNVFSNSKDARRFSKPSCMVVCNSGGWMVSIILFDPGLKARFVSAGHKGLQLHRSLVPFHSCDNVSVLPPCDRVLTGALSEDVPPVEVEVFEVGL
jgi:hypothetical protein